MKITNVTINQRFDDTLPLQAIASVVYDHCLVIHELRIIQGESRLFVAMPSRRANPSYPYRDIVHPINARTRRELEEAVLYAYHHPEDNTPAAPR